MRLSGVRLRVDKPAMLADFYATALGMTVRVIDGVWRVGYRGADADLLLLPDGGSYQHDRGQRYWKIGITLPDVDAAAASLRAAGIEVTEPKQFLDIGYMCHLSDPEGFQIELLQHEFEGPGRRSKNSGQPPFVEARIGQVTLRSGEMVVDGARCAALGMRLLSLQEVAPYGFDLHFYAFTAEEPPNPDLWSVENREWLWQRPYTTLEFQNIERASIVPTPDFQGLEIEGLAEQQRDAFGDLLTPA